MSTTFDRGLEQGGPAPTDDLDAAAFQLGERIGAALRVLGDPAAIAQIAVALTVLAARLELSPGTRAAVSELIVLLADAPTAEAVRTKAIEIKRALDAPSDLRLRARRPPIKARSPEERRAIMELTPCPSCGDDEAGYFRELEEQKDPSITIFACACQRCGTRRELGFAPLGAAEARRGFGDGVSMVLDAGELMLLHDKYIAQVPSSPDGVGVASLKAGLIFLGRSVACLEELVKMIPPGEDPVPRDAFYTARSDAFLDEWPGQFRGKRLAARIEEYGRIHNELKTVYDARMRKLGLVP